MIVDYHMHLERESGQLRLEPRAVGPYVETAIARGVDEIAFTEHVYYFRQTAEIWDLPYQRERCLYDLDAYCDVVLSAKEAGLPVKLGLEVDYVGERQDALAALLQPYPWDVLLGSVHWLDGLAVDMSPGIWDLRTVDAVWSDYVDALCRLAVSGHVDVLAHADLAKIFGRLPAAARLPELYARVAAAIAAAGACVEISTAGLRKPVGELYPALGLLEACVSMGVGATLASDAHDPTLVGQDFDRALELARAAGVREVTVFEGRSGRREALP